MLPNRPLPKALLIAMTGSLFIYLAHIGITFYWLNTLLGLISLYFLLQSESKTWFWSGFFFGLLWFWWITLSFIYYQISWATPFVILLIGAIYGALFWLIATTASISHDLRFTLVLKSVGLLVLSYIHPFGFDWFKPELIFVESYMGTQKWQFLLILLVLALVHWRKNLFFMLLLLVPHHIPQRLSTLTPSNTITIVTTHISVKDKWDKTKHAAQFNTLFHAIDQAIDANKTLVILPESVFPVFLDHNRTLLKKLKQRAKKINIVTGALYWDGKTPRNSTYIFTRDGRVTVANKVILVPFGEANPLPDFLGNWINHIFYDDAVDYKASSNLADYTIENKRYRNAICFEATSEKLYEGNPKQMIVLSNNGWFAHSIEPTLQRLLLQYYSQKYGTTIYNATNMTPSYKIINGKVFML
ncbi:MAG: apolipoprotein N-acyltransferase [Sulfurovum sp.]|nr:apolipoprotein N-acyltransferase [Sulfurovum sp.]MCB4759049.1 apolipoprotein N-acyltransferase [Sulfurovum sp.]MCB4762370.1 apolipoprotein N-acyltransferase [Sulfurovum sp.]MCB4764358.1 apolipoprotein N-acyltransferase [Sulfurovum sp.]MCB4774828.1 apolipoprotein N-acyltransferase [Sulfurovum sp.]